MKFGGGERLREKADVKLDLIVGGFGDDSGDRDPDEELLGLDPFEIGDGAVGELAFDGGFVVDELGEVDVARGVELDDEIAVGGEGVGLDGVGEEATWQAVEWEEVVDCFGGGGGEVEDEEEEEEEEGSDSG